MLDGLAIIFPDDVVWIRVGLNDNIILKTQQNTNTAIQNNTSARA